ncbi:MAG TPA: DinB family protein [Methylomirabilota bacterium]|nr:DinB family protein [Methylomirabilota bacterium]
MTADASGTPPDRGALVERFASFPDRLAVAARAAEGRAVPDGEWTPSLVVRHLMAVEGEVWLSRLATLAAGDEPHWSRMEPGPLPGFDAAPLEEILRLFGRLRASTVDFLRMFDDDGWARAGVHETYGRLDVAGLLRVAIDHDEEHLSGIGAG